jgi:hypothetical protein
MEGNMSGNLISVRYLRLTAVAATATLAMLGAGASAATAAPAVHSGPVSVTGPSNPGPDGNRNFRRTPAITPRALSMSPGCSGTTLPIDCTITEPVVTQRATTYSFTFVRGDQVAINAGGCVQTGGHGQTWKRYVDPASDNDLYHGTIAIPGTIGSTTSQVRLLNVVGRPFTVQGRGASLVLGYEDDGYSDNGYYSHDNGTGNQCLNSVNAFVHIVIN